MKTSLAPDQALFRAEHQIFSRSKGRSSCAASAYRSASKITDPRTGETFDYRDKGHVISSFIVAPDSAPDWIQDREQVWGRAELAERRQDAQVAREWLITIPRDIPVNQWEPFTREIVAPWIDAGAIADIAIHCPLDQYGQPQPHAHIMLTMRKLDSGTETGFASKKNADLEALHASGGRYGGERGDKLKIQRERIATVMNEHLERANSPRRVSHLSNVARELDQAPEPTMGEQRIQTAKSLKKPDHVINEVANHRAIRATKQALSQLEEEIMSDYPKMQSDTENGIRPRHQQDFKRKLMTQHLPGVAGSSDDIHMIDAKDPKKLRVNMRDGGWVEVENRKVTIYGPAGMADKMGAAIVTADRADYIDRLTETAAITRRGQKPRPRQQATPSGDIPASYRLPETAIESIADKWRSRGYTNVIEAPDGVYVTIGQARLQDLGTEVRIHGKASDPAINALLAKSLEEWGGELEAYGSTQFKDALWLEAQRKGVKVYDQSGKVYEPSPEIRAQFEADRAKLDAQVLDLEGIRQRKKVSDLMLEAASGNNKEALSDLKERDYHLWLLLTNFDEDQIAAFRAETIESIEANLDGFRAVGRDIEQDAGTPESASQAPTPDDEPEPRKTKAPQPA
ncbi:MobA/MobL family protein [Brucella anthropi]|uniref:MobA/MobL family protein n=1 Tax=Brucella anthropi TaxID=529 RepID=UPI001CFC7D8E|nr:MobA/MobL family protein [Brucella anthropi]